MSISTFLSPSCKLKAAVLALVLYCNSAQAQFVTIPDSGFVDYLSHFGYNSCLNGNQLDTTCTAVLNAHYIDISYRHVSDLQGIQYFKNLDSLRCNADSLLTNIPALPPHLKVLECRNNALDSLPALPDSLLRLVCESNNLSKLPPLPNTLQSLSCYNNQLHVLPALPIPLVYLFCSGNHLDTLPALPAGLLSLSCYSNNLPALPVLPASLQQLLCSHNPLHGLPTLPNALAYIDCSSDVLTTLPALPATLVYLGCAHNQLTALPALPGTVTMLNCEYNDLSSLPATLPDTMSQLFCDNNPHLYCLPALTNITDLEFYQTGITCAPNYGNVTYSTPSLNALPLCDAGNTHGCLVIPVSGIAEASQLSFSIYPNPASDLVTITTANDIVNGMLQVSDITGKQLIMQAINGNRFEVQTASLPAGIYFVKVNDYNGRASTGKLVIQ